MDIDPDSGDVSQMKAVDYAKNCIEAHDKKVKFNLEDENGWDGSRAYYFLEIKH